MLFDHSKPAARVEWVCAEVSLSGAPGHRILLSGWNLRNNGEHPGRCHGRVVLKLFRCLQHQWSQCITVYTHTAKHLLFMDNIWTRRWRLQYLLANWGKLLRYQYICPPITYYWTGVLILDHSYLVENLTINSKIAETKALEPSMPGTFVSAIFKLVNYVNSKVIWEIGKALALPIYLYNLASSFKKYQLSRLPSQRLIQKLTL